MNPSVILFSVVKDSAEPADFGIAIVTVLIVDSTSFTVDIPVSLRGVRLFGFYEKKYFLR